MASPEYRGPIYEIDRNGERLAWRQTQHEAQVLADELVLDAKHYFNTAPEQMRIMHEHRAAGSAAPVLWQDIIYSQELGKQWYQWDGRPNPLVVFTCRVVPFEAKMYTQEEEEQDVVLVRNEIDEGDGMMMLKKNKKKVFMDGRK